MDFAAALRAFAAVFPAELPDKTMVATLVLVAHHRRAFPVWCGAAAAFTIHVILAVAAGQVLRLLPDTAVTLVTAALFAVGAVVLWRGSREPLSSQEETGDASGRDGAGRGTPDPVAVSVAQAEAEAAAGAGVGEEPVAGVAGGSRSRSLAPSTPALAAFAGSFGVVLLAEAGDLTQLATASIAANSGSPLAVAAGALAALWLVAALAAALGRRLASHLPVRILKKAAATIFATLAAIALVTLIA